MNDSEESASRESGRSGIAAPQGVDSNLPAAVIGGLPIAAIDRAATARLMIDLALARRGLQRRALVLTSANGHVLSLCAVNHQIRSLFLRADFIHADGKPMVFASRLLSSAQLPERVATTDLFHDVAELAQQRGATFYLLGATGGVVEKAVEQIRRRYPRLQIVGYRDGYFGSKEEPKIIEAINKVRPDILWLGMGVPSEQFFAIHYRDKLRNVGIIKTSGGLFDFLSEKNRRAPAWMQAAGLEWVYRTCLEPRRLAGRYLATNPFAVYLLLTRTKRKKTAPRYTLQYRSAES